MVLIEAVSRQIPGVVQLADSVEQDSFRNGLLDYPHYTRPPVIEGLAVPDVLLSGNHAAIRRWRDLESLRVTWEKRPDLLRCPEARARLTREQARALDEMERNRAAPPGGELRGDAEIEIMTENVPPGVLRRV